VAKKAKITYTVHSRNSGAQICGPYAAVDDATRERDRLNGEARTGTREKPSRRGGRDKGEPINFHERQRCARCATRPEPDRDGILACPKCKSVEFEVEEIVATPILHAGEQQEYEIKTSEGVVLP